MSIEGKRIYRMVFLHSETWHGVRAEAHQKQKSQCLICGEADFSNDVHHIVYAASMWDTEAEHVIVLCRPCHDLTHRLLGMPTTRAASVRRLKELIVTLHLWRGEKKMWLDGDLSEYRETLHRFYKALSPKNQKERGICLVCREQRRVTNAINPFQLMSKTAGTHGYGKASVLCDECFNTLKSTFDGQSLPAKPWKSFREWIKQRRRQLLDKQSLSV